MANQEGENNILQILDMKDEATQKIWTDQLGRFPKKTSKGCQYMMVLTESESNAILVEAMKIERQEK
jgi:hypothetical protein